MPICASNRCAAPWVRRERGRVVRDGGVDFEGSTGRQQLLGIRESLTLMRLALDEFETTSQPPRDILRRMEQAIEAIDRDLQRISQVPGPYVSGSDPMYAEQILRDAIARVGPGLAAAGITPRVKPSRGFTGVEGPEWHALCLRVLAVLFRGAASGDVDFEILATPGGPLLTIELRSGVLHASAKSELEAMENVRLCLVSREG